MIHVKVLTPGFTTPNGCAFLFPLVAHRRTLLEADIRVAFHKRYADPQALADCDVLIIDSKFYTDRWVPQSEAVVAEIVGAERAHQLRALEDGWPGDSSVYSGHCQDEP